MLEKADILQALHQGDLVEVHWWDILEDSVGDVKTASVGERVSFGIFWEMKDTCDTPALVTTTTIDKVNTGQSGFCAYPLGAVKDIKLIRRARKGRKHGHSS